MSRKDAVSFALAIQPGKYDCAVCVSQGIFYWYVQCLSCGGHQLGQDDVDDITRSIFGELDYTDDNMETFTL